MCRFHSWTNQDSSRTFSGVGAGVPHQTQSLHQMWGGREHKESSGNIMKPHHVHYGTNTGRPDH